MSDREFVAQTRRLLAAAESATQAGDASGAAGTYRIVACRHPGVAVGWVQAATAAQVVGDAAAAVSLLHRALILEPSLVPAAELLAEVSTHESPERRHRATAIWAITHSRSAAAFGALASSHQQARRFGASLRSARRALQLNPDLGWVRANLAVVLRGQDDPGSAAMELRRAALLDPANGLVWRRLAGLREVLSDLQGAEIAARRALAVDGDDHAASMILALAERRLGQLQQALVRLEALPEQMVGEVGRDAVEFELGALRDRLGDPAAAYDHFVRGNTIAADRAEPSAADPAPYLAAVAGFETAMTPDWLSRWAPLADRTSPAVFMVGFPRSGTTLLDQILDAHPDVRVIEEQPVLAGLGASFAQPPDTVARRLAVLSDDRAEFLRAGLATRLHRWGGERLPSVVVDKMPLNIVYLPLALRLYPTAKVILSLRHPCDCCLSCFMQPIRLNPAMASFTSLDGATALYARVMALWERVAEALSPDHEIVRYEDLIGDVEGTARRVLDFLDLDWNDAVIDHTGHARSRGVIRTPSFRQVSEPIYTRAKGRWEKYRPQMAPYLHRLRPYITSFGYDDPD
ncbi:MAG: sulfotransferase [Thalassobaculaceae bacterium]|nr:sulfotransferase [Thalassobaculaceae bacterium]